MTFQSKLNAIIKKNNSLVCVGLDSDITKLPLNVSAQDNPQFTFNKAIIDATHDLVCCYKPNAAFYEARGNKGLQELKMTCNYLHGIYPDIPIILDAKRADIGSTNNGYVRFAYKYLNVDAMTLNPYLGKEAIKPFLEIPDKGAIILCKTSNEGSGEIQNLSVNGKKLYEVVADKVAHEWNTSGNCGLVVGATYPKELQTVRKIARDMILLVPGVGAQGGDVEKIIKAGLNSQNAGLIINASRSIIFASSEDDFAEKAKTATKKLRDEINTYR